MSDRFYVPVPESNPPCWGPPSPVATTVAVRAPVADGVNVTRIVQLPPPGTLEPQLLVWEKSERLVPTILIEKVKQARPRVGQGDVLGRTGVTYRHVTAI